MEFYICFNCGSSFRQPKMVTESHGEKHAVSPCCGDSYSPGARCSYCGREMLQAESRHGLCRKCAWSTIEHFRWYLLNNFSSPQRAVLNDAFDGVPLTEPEQVKAL